MEGTKEGKKEITLRTGDVFGTENPMALGTVINAAQRFWSSDNQSKYTHSGIIINRFGDTFESLWTITASNLLNAYAGKDVIIARPVASSNNRVVSFQRKRRVIRRLMEKYSGTPYPGWRLLLHTVPPAAKYISFLGIPVCSELVAMYLENIGVRDAPWAGTNPDTLADEWTHWKGSYELIYEGNLDGCRLSV